MGMFGNSGGTAAGIGSKADSKYGFRRAFAGDPLRIGLSEEDRQSAADERWVDASEVVLHYTNLNGLIGIIESGGLWASDNRLLNDSEEVSHGIDFISNMLRSNIKTSSLPSFTRVLELALERVNSRLSEGQLVVCYSLAKDSLEQWRAYGKNDGVCLSFNTRLNGHLPLFKSPPMVMQRVFYEKRDKEAFVLRKILRFLKAFAEDEKKYGELSHDVQRSYADYLSMSMSAAIAAFKNPSFATEAEVRMVVSFEQARYFEGGIKFRRCQFGPIAYVNTFDFKHPPGLLASLITNHTQDEGSGLLPLTSVMVGPSPRQELVMQSLRTFLDEKGYRAVDIEASRVPFRGP